MRSEKLGRQSERRAAPARPPASNFERQWDPDHTPSVPRSPVPSRLGHEFGRIHVHARATNASVPPDSPAWTDHGQIFVRPMTLLLPQDQRAAIIRHERVHQMQQSLFPRDESVAAGARAEAAARSLERGAAGARIGWQDITPAPSLLFYPPQAYSPWNQVWIGHPGLVMEVAESGIVVRTYRDYADLGIKPASYLGYECGKHDPPGMPDLAAKMRTAAKVASKANTPVPATAASQRISLIIVGELVSAFRVYNGAGVIELNAKEFATNPEDTVTHEASHALFEYHSVAGSAAASPRVPDTFALRVADLYATLSTTQVVDVPTKLFDPTHPPPLPAPAARPAPSAGELGPRPGKKPHAAGLVMVMDTLWSGAGGHPWDGVDEFFASAYAGYVRKPTLLRKIIDHYQKADSTIAPAAKSLLELLDAVANPKKMKAITSPSKPGAATAELAAVEAPLALETLKEGLGLGWIESHRNYMLEPTEMPSPKTIVCPKPSPTSTTPAPAPAPEPSLEDLLK